MKGAFVKMDIISYRYFMSVAECLNFSEAAERNYISQSSLSKKIINLEKELSVNLFDRQHHPTSLTPAGKCLYQHLLQIAPLYMETLEDLEKYSEHKTISCYVVPKSYAIRNSLKNFNDKNPGIEVIATMSSNYETEVEEFLSNDYDFAIVHRPLQVPPEIKTTFLYDDELYVVTARNHEFSSRTSITMAELDGQTFIESSFSKTLLHVLAKNYKFRPARVLPKEDVNITREEVIQQVSLNMGISIYCGRDISMFRAEKFTNLKLLDAPSIPVVLLEKANQPATEWREKFRQYAKTNIEPYVGPKEE